MVRTLSGGSIHPPQQEVGPAAVRLSVNWSSLQHVTRIFYQIEFGWTQWQVRAIYSCFPKNNTLAARTGLFLHYCPPEGNRPLQLQQAVPQLYPECMPIMQYIEVSVLNDAGVCVAAQSQSSPKPNPAHHHNGPVLSQYICKPLIPRYQDQIMPALDVCTEAESIGKQHG